MDLTVSSLRLINFKNYQDHNFSFDKRIVAIIGKNGIGKTNLLDSLHYLSQTKSFLNYQDQLNIRHGESFFSIMARVSRNSQQYQVDCQFQAGSGKKVMVDRNEWPRKADHIGWLPIVLIAPDDIALINESNEIRRKWIDMVISHVDGDYLDALIRYNNLLRQRNALLKKFQESGHHFPDQLEPYDHQLLPLSKTITTRRQTFFNDILERLNLEYKQLSGGREAPGYTYSSEVLRENFDRRFKNSQRHDIAAGRTLLGAHRDKITFTLNGEDVRLFASQGQKKSFLIALKLTQYHYFSNQLNLLPLLLLDDIFDRLDEDRIANLLKIVNTEKYGQLFITDAREARCKTYMKNAGLDVQLIELE